MSNWPFKRILTEEDALTERFGNPSDTVQRKVIEYMDDNVKSFIRQSPIVFLSTANAEGQCDVSPRGDQPGFIGIVDDQHLVIPERPGNRRFDSLRNIISNPHVGLIFIIPGLRETLRMNGKACVIDDDDILSAMQVSGKRPWLGIGVKVEECYMHCAKAMIRSALWNPDTWLEEEERPNVARILAGHVQAGYTEDDIQQALKESYEKRLY